MTNLLRFLSKSFKCTAIVCKILGLQPDRK
jgi:hypothetical protein